MISLRALLLGLLLIPVGTAAIAATCAIGVPGCCSVNADCSDGDLCTGVETCTIATGTCVAGATVVCNDLDPCTTDSCNPSNGRCVFGPAPAGTPCNDLDACTQTDTCQGRVCVGSDPVVCNDSNDCTVDACIPATGACSFVPDDSLPCDDGDACSQVDRCEAGSCVGSQPVDCDDTDPCTTDMCDSGTGSCAHGAVPDATPCDDGDACTQTDGCVGGVCVGADPVSCDDDVACTTDACVDGVCTFSPADALCDDDECFEGRCRPADATADAFGCVSAPIREGETCSDEGVACTDDVCAAGVCVHVPLNGRCLVDDVCATATCVPTDPGADADGCTVMPGEPDGTGCTEDLDPCTRDRCLAGVCEHQDVDDPAACDPVREPFRQTLVLATFARDLRTEVLALAGLNESRRLGLLGRLDLIIYGLDRAAAQMNGADPTADTAQARATGAYRFLKRMPRHGRRLVRLVRRTRKRDPVDSVEVERIRRMAIDLRRGLRELKRDVRRLRRSLRSFVR